ncbi:MAG: DMP19 family protein [Flavobacteriales bacterium]|nr:DMP19 family protein [Flavobacteriales bacterium]MCB9192493.1 DMP19 family protein [Flavobacteriales bacterium]
MGLFDSLKKKSSGLDIDKILNEPDTTNAIIELDDWLNDNSNYGSDLEKLSPTGRVVLVVENLEREINNGGFNQFYFNSSGDYAHETVDYLKKIGANKTAEIVETANAQWPDGNVPKDRNDRQETLEEIEVEADPVWEECDTKFYEYQDDIAGLLLDLVRANRAEFE